MLQHDLNALQQHADSMRRILERAHGNGLEGKWKDRALEGLAMCLAAARTGAQDRLDRDAAEDAQLAEDEAENRPPDAGPWPWREYSAVSFVRALELRSVVSVPDSALTPAQKVLTPVHPGVEPIAVVATVHPNLFNTIPPAQSDAGYLLEHADGERSWMAKGEFEQRYPGPVATWQALQDAEPQPAEPEPLAEVIEAIAERDPLIDEAIQASRS